MPPKGRGKLKSKKPFYKRQNIHKMAVQKRSMSKKARRKQKKPSLLTKQGRALEAKLVEVVIKDILEHRKKLSRQERNEQLSKAFLSEMLKEEETVQVKGAKQMPKAGAIDGEDDMLSVTSESHSLTFTPRGESGFKMSSKRRSREPISVKLPQEYIRKPNEAVKETPQEVTTTTDESGEESGEEEESSETEEQTEETTPSPTAETEEADESEDKSSQKSPKQSKKTPITVVKPNTKSDPKKKKQIKSAKTDKVIIVQQNGKPKSNSKKVKELHLAIQDVIETTKKIKNKTKPNEPAKEQAKGGAPNAQATKQTKQFKQVPDSKAKGQTEEAEGEAEK